MILEMSDFKTQSDPMSAIDMVLEEYENGFMSGIELIHAVKAINTEWHI